VLIVRYKLRCVKDSPVLIGDYQLFHETGVPENARGGCQSAAPLAKDSFVWDLNREPAILDVA
jgi:hypothetical protein